MKSEIYIKLVIIFFCGFFIFSSIKEYLYNQIINVGVKDLNEITQKNVSPEKFADGFRTAELAFEKAISFMPDRDLPYNYLGAMYIDYINADFEKKLAVTENSGFTEDVAQKKSIENLEKTIKINPFNMDAYFLLAWIYEHADRGDDAERVISLVEAKEVGKVRIQLKLLEWAVYKNNSEKIKKYVQRIFEANPNKLVDALSIVWRIYQDYETIKDIVPLKAKAREIFARFLKEKNLNEEARLEEEYAKTLAE